MNAKWWITRVPGLLVGFISAAALLYSTSSSTQTSAQVIFVTNTPVPSQVFPAPPAADFERYALRLWREADWVELLIAQVEQLADDQASTADQALAILFTQHALAQRFPNAPTQPAQRDRLLRAMLDAPRGLVDLRVVARPALVDLLNAQTALPIDETPLQIGDFVVMLRPLNLDTREPVDVLIHVRAPMGAAEQTTDAPTNIRYEDLFPVVRMPDGRLALPDGVHLLPAAPFGEPAVIFDQPPFAFSRQTLALGRAGDLNEDGRDELAVLLTTKNAINQELRVVGWRENRLVNLVLPGERLIFGRLVDWPLGSTTFQVALYRLESAAWNCVSALDVTWAWSLNFFRPTAGEAYQPLDSVGCDLVALEPIFARPPQESITAMNAILLNAQPNEPGTDRARMALAMLHLLAGQPDQAQTQLDILRPLIGLDDWVTGQVEAFQNVARRADTTPLDVCAGLMAERPNAACNVDQALAQLFTQRPLLRAAPLVQQLEALGLVIDEVVTVSEVGRLDRQVIRFNLTGASWWAFAPTTDDLYVPTPTESPVPVITALPVRTQLDAPLTAYQLLLVENDPQAALTALSNAINTAPGVPLSPAARYLQAMCYDLLGDRLNSRRAYYDLWAAFPADVWGRLAAAQLEQR